MSYDQEDFQDMNQMTRRGINWHDFSSGGQDRSMEFMDGPHHCVAILRHGPRWQGGYIYMMHASICHIDAASAQPQDIAYVLSNLDIRQHDPVGNLRKTGP